MNATASQNRSTAVMSRRVEPHDSLDFFPTPPWGTRALLKVAMAGERFSDLTCWEPACGIGSMAAPLSESFGEVISTDIFPYGTGEVHDFLMPYLPSELKGRRPDWICSNPPFRLGDQFIFRALEVAQRGVAMLVRTSFVESDDRYKSIFRCRPPTQIAQFVERLPIVKGRLDPEASSATAYAWLIWRKQDDCWISVPGVSQFTWIAPCRAELERDADYPIIAGESDAGPLFGTEVLK